VLVRLRAQVQALLRTRLNLRELNRATLARQALLERAPGASPVVMIERLAGLQAQEPKPPFIGLWSRIEGFEADDLREALRSGDVVRATLMRATLHLFSARDYTAFRTALQPALDGSMQGVLKARKADVDIDKTLAAARRLLAGGKKLTFDDIRDALSEQFPDADHRALGYVARTGLPLAMVPTDDPWGFARDSQFSLVSKVDQQAATEELVRRYLAAFGPASPIDMQIWSGLKGLKDSFAAIEAELEVVDGPNGKLYDLPDAPRPDADTPAPVRFLPAFDNMLLGHKDRTRVIDDEHRPKVVTKNLRIHPTFLVDGFVAGMWQVKATKKKATLTLEPFVKLTKNVQKELADEGEALLRLAEPEVPDVAVGISG
jgi:hypothetical protein